MEIGRLLTAMITPFTSDGKVNYEQARRLAQALLDSGSEGVVVAGTTGEAPTLTHDEKVRLFAEVKGALGTRGAVIAGTGTYDTAESIALSLAAQREGVDALLLTTPYYSKPSQEGLYRHFAAITEAVSLPCIIYNIPGRTAVNLSVETQLRIAELPSVAGVKESSGDLVQISRIIEDAPGSYRVWSGDDQLTLPILAAGGYGIISVAAHLVGSQMQRMIEAHLDGRTAEAASIHRKLIPLMTTLMTAAPNPVAVKFAVNHAGFDAGGVRLPHCEPDAAGAEHILAAMKRQHIDLAVAV